MALLFLLVKDSFIDDAYISLGYARNLALHFHWGLIADETSLERSDLLAAILDAPFFNTNEQIETLYLATLSRQPRPSEIQRTIAFFDSSEGKTPDKARKEALADVFWALLNSGEFLLNH